MKLTRWNSFDNQLPTINDIFNDFFGSHGNRVLSEQTLPGINTREDEKEYIIEVGIPGMKKEDCNIDIHDGYITLSAESTKNMKDYSRCEYNYTSFSRTMALPSDVNENEIKAKYENGELIINLPKTLEEKTTTKKIAID